MLTREMVIDFIRLSLNAELLQDTGNNNKRVISFHMAFLIKLPVRYIELQYEKATLRRTLNIHQLHAEPQKLIDGKRPKNPNKDRIYLNLYRVGFKLHETGMKFHETINYRKAYYELNEDAQIQSVHGGYHVVSEPGLPLLLGELQDALKVLGRRMTVQIT